MEDIKKIISTDFLISLFFLSAGCDSDWLSGLFPQVKKVENFPTKFLKACTKIIFPYMTNIAMTSYQIILNYTRVHYSTSYHITSYHITLHQRMLS